MGNWHFPWKGLFLETSRLLKGFSTYRDCFQAAAFGWKHQTSKWHWNQFFSTALEYGILSLSKSKTIMIIIIQIIKLNISLSKQVNQVLNNMMQIDSINSLAFKIQCTVTYILVLHHCALFCILYMYFPYCVLCNMLILWFQDTSMKLFTCHLLPVWDRVMSFFIWDINRDCWPSPQWSSNLL